jgi:hypothetical protein
MARRKLSALESAKKAALLIAFDPKVSGPTRLRALDRYCVLNKLYAVQLVDQIPSNGEKLDLVPVVSAAQRSESKPQSDIETVLAKYRGENGGVDVNPA